MSFTYNSKGINMDTNYLPAPEGIYTLQIVDAIEKVTKIKADGSGGDPMVSIKCEIADIGEWLGNTVWNNVTFMKDKTKRGAGMAIAFLKAIGEPWEGEIDVVPERWETKRFRAKLTVEKDLNGVNRNKVAYLVTDEPKEDDVPF